MKRAISRDIDGKRLDRAVARILAALQVGELSERFLWEAAGCSADVWVEARFFLIKEGLIEVRGTRVRRVE